MRTLAYIRVSTDKQTEENQRHEISTYCKKRDIKIDREISITVSSRQNSKERRIDELVQELFSGDTLIVTELSRLGRKTQDVISLIEDLINMGVTVIIIKSGWTLSASDPMSKMMVSMFASFCELERDLISQRTKEALASRKAQGVKLGKPENLSNSAAGTKRSAEVRSESADKFAEKVLVQITRAEAEGVTTLQAISEWLNDRKFRTSRGAIWTPTAVKRVKARMESSKLPEGS